MTEIIVPNYDGLILVDIAVDTPSISNRSVITSRRQIIGQPGAERWYIMATIDTLTTEEDERPWRAFTFALKGAQNWFKFNLDCQYHAGNKPTVAAGASNAYTLPLSGMQPSTRILYAGQYMTVPLPSGHGRLVCLLSDLTADAGGNGTATFNVALNETPVFGATVETYKPYVPVNSSENRLGLQYSNGASGTNLTLEEAI
jgi:hypothetical protein